jgi:pimeloyl-ACP methyl ester carboxylesterase
MKSIYRKSAGEIIFKTAYQKTLSEWPVPYSTFYVNTRFGKTHVIAVGPEDAPPLVLLHGFGFSSTMWINNIKDLSESYRVYALDFIGDINLSEAAAQIETKRDCADWFSDVLDELDVEKTNVLGMSYGGFLALIFAIYEPDKVGKLITICPGASLRKQKSVFFMRSLWGGMLPSTKNITRLMNYMTGKGNVINETIKQQFIIAMQNCFPRVKVFAHFLKDEEVQKIKSKTLLLLGDQEVQYDPILAIKRAQELIPNLKAVLIKGAGHGVSLEKPKVVNKHILDFLSEE